MRALIVAAHPDDEVLGCGGTIAKMAKEGHEVYVAILGEGATARHSDPSQGSGAAVRRLQECSRAVADLLGIREVIVHNLPDNRFDTAPLLDIVRWLEGVLDRIRPEVVYTHHGGDLNIDHALTFRATLTAARPLPGTPVKAIYAYEVPSSTDWAFQSFSTPFRPNVFVDIADTLEIKLEAMAAYDSETRPFPHPRSAEALSASARRWGSAAGVAAAEAFELVRALR
ncbi:MAG TPA: PIG-L family deacetylase [Candidatus Hydrogenedentes bacterium]|nr:PIG-L family deacetylase [Candidatus Hydrogenedentota bacterium]HIJ74452.1 PIG-L family deacetylase [Candidatus Hydrogenedentota bacterium]